MAFLSIALLAGLNQASPIVTVNTDFQATFFSLSAQLQDVCRCPSGLDSEPTCKQCDNCFGTPATLAPRALPVTTTKAPSCPICITLYSPICGDNGVTYGSQCALDFDNCKNGKNVKKVSSGVCKSTTTPKPTTPKPVATTVPPQTRSLNFDLDLDLRVLCLPLCPLLLFPVCGSDGKTYPNYCFLARERCLNAPDLQLADPRSCKVQATVTAPLTDGDSPTRRTAALAGSSQMQSSLITSGGGFIASASSTTIVFSSGSAPTSRWSSPSISSDSITDSVNAMAPSLLDALCTCSSDSSSSSTPQASTRTVRVTPQPPVPRPPMHPFDEFAADLLDILLPPFAPPKQTAPKRNGRNGRGLAEKDCDPNQRAQCIGSPDDAAVNVWDADTCTCNPQSGGSAVTNPQDCVSPCVSLGLCASPSDSVSASDVALAQCLTCVRDCFLLSQRTGGEDATTVAPPSEQPATTTTTAPATTPAATTAATTTTKQPAVTTTKKPVVTTTTTTKKPAATTTKKPVVATPQPRDLPCCQCPVSSPSSGSTRITGLFISSSTTVTSSSSSRSSSSSSSSSPSSSRSSSYSSPKQEKDQKLGNCMSLLKDTLSGIFRDGASSTASSPPSSSSWSNFVSGMYREHEHEDKNKDKKSGSLFPWQRPVTVENPRPQPAGLPGQPRGYGPAELPWDTSLDPINYGTDLASQRNSRVTESFNIAAQARVTTTAKSKKTTAKPKATTPKPKATTPKPFRGRP